MPKLLAWLAILLTSAPVSNAGLPRIVFWNVGQGFWATWSEPHFCVHFDMGGEFFDSPRLARECASKQNRAVFSHWDWDHIGLALKGRRILGNLCVARRPGGRPTPTKEAFLGRLPACESRFDIRELRPGIVAKRSNAASRVFVYRDVLLPGDSESGQEKFWSRELRPREIEVLALGHHGSKTSTSEFLLSRLSMLKTAVASSRKRVYGHPHPTVAERLRRRGVSLLRTEIWGSIVLGR